MPLRPAPDAARTWALTLTAIPSVTGTTEEAAFATRFADMLRARPAFAGRAADVWTIPVPGGRFPRACVAALVRGRGAETVVLTGHFDTVRTDDYGDLRDLALDPEALRPALLARLAEPASDAERQARDDLASGAFLPGRGLMDMKSGLAAALAVLEAFAAAPDRIGNLLFLAVPDEEANSAGARAAAPALHDIAARHGLAIVAAINLDSIGDPGDGTAGRQVALGSVGKLLPSALVVGRAAHVADSFTGLGACALAGSLAAAMEWAPELVERTGEEVASGPTLLGMRDTKPGYDVTMPGSVWMFWNVACHRQGPVQVMDAVRAIAGRALADTVAALGARRQAALGDGALPEVAVLSYSELLASVLARRPQAEAAIAALAAEVAEAGLDLPEQCRRITEKVLSLSGRSGPAVVLGFASLPYLPATLGPDANAVRLAAAVREATSCVGARHGTSIGTCAYFRGISDMSFIGQADAAAIPAIARDTPCWGAGLPWPDGPALGEVPIVNAGPWGRDYHTPLERVDAAYAFTVLPDLVAEIVERMLGHVG
ncbi:Arginine utilization protein RocB [Rhodovastum atsumiense]|uniref:M20/M25/M40 family metallo-hydrolase n=1 Tax=Rhodovastum atsumiense TaxID=504468 RepID=A0A5M6IMK3_9PROT|nr:M20/M25/M40 family metallo-hydrolase [Rhodovastum atsumiense]KAA5609500.1 M20/M25/M40 family metallo-hydrolase [Rhodovastum atsumiense]CAH2600802.1 Arginine utilization protein RocB [Rhodovastum atsumiense]